MGLLYFFFRSYHGRLSNIGEHPHKAHYVQKPLGSLKMVFYPILILQFFCHSYDVFVGSKYRFSPFEKPKCSYLFIDLNAGIRYTILILVLRYLEGWEKM